MASEGSESVGRGTARQQAAGMVQNREAQRPHL